MRVFSANHHAVDLRNCYVYHRMLVENAGDAQTCLSLTTVRHTKSGLHIMLYMSCCIQTSLVPANAETHNDKSAAASTSNRTDSGNDT